MAADPGLVLELITRSGGLDSNLAPLMHENSKLWPYHRMLSREAPGSPVPAHDLLASQAPATPVSNSRIRTLLAATTWRGCEKQLGMRPPPVLRCYLLVWRVPGMHAASYYYYPPTEALILIRRLTRDAPGRVSIPSEGLARYDGLIAACALVRYDGESHGERRYRDVLVAAGILAERSLRAGARTGLDVRLVTDFLDDPLAIELGLAAAHEQPLAVVAFRSDHPWSQSTR